MATTEAVRDHYDTIVQLYRLFCLIKSMDEPRSDEEGDYWPVDFADWREIPYRVFQLLGATQQHRKYCGWKFTNVDNYLSECVVIASLSHVRTAC